MTAPLAAAYTTPEHDALATAEAALTAALQAYRAAEGMAADWYRRRDEAERTCELAPRDPAPRNVERLRVCAAWAGEFVTEARCAWHLATRAIAKARVEAARAAAQQLDADGEE